MARVVTNAGEAGDSAASGDAAPAGRTSAALGRYSHSLDGLRALAMFFFLAYHAEFTWAKGAYLGLSQFFTLSGFLIMSMLLRAQERTHQIDLRHFWSARFRRLLPAALITLAGVVVFGATVATPSQLHRLPSQVLACLAYVVNWLFIFTHQSYVDLFASPSPVQHFWSLAVEEQFYLLMPIGLYLLLRKTRSMKVIGGIFLGLAAASAIEMAVLYRAGYGVDRVYYGTDTRAGELLMGVVLAIVLYRRPLGDGTLSRKVLPVAGVVALALSVVAFVTVPLTEPFIWSGGMALFTLLSVTLIASIVSGRGPAAWLLSRQPLPAFGRIIYGVYLFHWPIFLWLTEERTGLSQWPLFGLRLLVTISLAIVSYHLIEMPIRRGELHRLSVPVRRAIIPTAMVLILVGTVLVSHRNAYDPLATLAGAQNRPAPASAGTLKVMVVTDSRGAGLADEMKAATARYGKAEVTSVVPFRCTAATADGPGCANWSADFADAVAQQNPDVVLFAVSTWPPTDVAAVSGVSATGNGAGQYDWVHSALSRGFDQLTAKGATIVWVPFDPPTFAQGLAEAAQPFTKAMNQLVGSRSDLRSFSGDLPTRTKGQTDASWDTSVADALMPGLDLYARGDGSGGVRVLVVGDSTGRSMAWGLQRWGTSTGKATVWSTAVNGCGIALGGQSKEMGGTIGTTSTTCEQARAAWAQQIKEFKPQVVVVSSTLTDLLARKLDGWDGFLEPGNPTFDKYLIDQYTSAVDTLTAGGAKVVWMQTPCMGYGGSKLLGQGAPDPSAFDKQRALDVDHLVLPQVVAKRPGQVGIFPTYQALCPDGSFQANLDGVSDVRPDGVHFSVAGAQWFADTYGQQLIDTKPQG